MEGERRCFQRQPARAILVDLSPPLDNGSGCSIYESLSNTLTFINHLHGPPRLPLISIIILGNYPECILPFQPVRGNFSRVLMALNELKSLTRSMVAGQQHVRGCILEGLQEAIVQFNRLLQNSKQSAATADFPSQVEVTLITGRSSSYLHNLVEKFANHLDLDHLKKISAVIVTNPDSCSLMDTNFSKDESNFDREEWKDHMTSQDDHMTSTISDIGMSILDVQTVENNTLSLQNTFRCWLHDYGTDCEHLHLILPHTSSSSLRSGEHIRDDTWGSSDLMGGAVGGHDNEKIRRNGLILKCDIRERLLDPLATLDPKIGDKFSIHVISSSPTPSPTHNGHGISNPFLPVYKLRASHTVSAKGVCESLVFGVPLILCPTTCWKLEWEDLETNQQSFHAFCKLLSERNLMLVAQAEHTSAPLTPYFIILPSSSSHTLLIKSIAPGELLLPSETTGPEEQPDPMARKIMEKALSMLDHHDSYNPLLVQSGLHEALSSLSATTRGSSLHLQTHQDKGRGRVKSIYQHSTAMQGQPLSSREAPKGRGRSAPSSSGGKSLGTSRRGYNKGHLELK